MSSPAGGLPAPRIDQLVAPEAGLPPPSSPGVVRKLVIVAGSGGGLFVYAPTAALGNLIASIAATAGTDPYGNAYQAGVVAYHLGSWVQLDGAELVFNGGANISQSGIGGVGMFFAGTAGVNTLQSNLPIVNGWLVTQPPGTAATIETWHLISTGFPAGWGNNATGNTHGIGYRYLAEAAQLVMLDIQLTMAASTVITNNEVIATLPAGWRPLNATAITVPMFLNGAGGETNVQLNINTNGTITWGSPGITTPAGGGSSIFGTGIFQLAV